jgi:hypothetical protein
VRTLTFVVPDPPPFRDHPGRSADRNSPHAGPLARAGQQAVDSSPEEFPFIFAGMTVTFGRTMWNVREFGFSTEDPLYEVLCDVGAACEPGSWSSYTTQDPVADFYVVTFTTERPTHDREPHPEFIRSELPEEFSRRWRQERATFRATLEWLRVTERNG